MSYTDKTLTFESDKIYYTDTSFGGDFEVIHDVGNNQGIPLFLSDTTAGQAIIAAPDTSGDIVRIIGYNLGNDDQIWFSPDNTFVEVA